MSRTGIGAVVGTVVVLTALSLFFGTLLLKKGH